MDGGRGEVARVAFAAGGIAFEDDRIPFKEWPSRKPTTPFRAIPVLHVDDTVLVQSNSINRYVGKLVGLYPEDALQAAFCDETMDLIEDAGIAMVATFSIQDEEEKKKARQALADGTFTIIAKGLAARLAERGGEWFADRRFTVADIKVFLWVRHLRSGNIDHVPVDLLERIAPALIAHFDRVNAHPKVRSYYGPRGR
jgi:glutathione S-transferase